MEAATTSELIRGIVAAPLIGTLLNGLLGRRWNRRGERLIVLVGCGSVAVSLAAALVVVGRLLALPEESRLLVDHLYTWIHVGGFRADVAFTVDPLSAVMILVVAGVGFLIHVYSVGYMHKDPGFWRYFTYLNLFMFSMLLLVLGNNLLLLFIGWEGVGLCSYLLIGFWYEDREKASAGKKAFVVNRIGDFGFILGVLLLFWSLSAVGHPTVSFGEIQEHVGLLADKAVSFHLPGAGPQVLGLCTLIGLLLFVGAIGKSAQIPLYVWLPDAMAGPTPVSALIHAATMVTAGVYMVARMHFLFDIAPGALQVVAVVGAATAFFAATIGIAQTDIKKVLAYSTVSQLGYMFLACGVGAYTAAIFHLMTHAFFKGLLFLGSGSVIHGMGGEQDIRKMGGLAKLMPITTWTFLVATLAISGIPPFSGFFSKDEILFQTSQHATVLWTVGAAAAFITAFYMFRLFFLTFTGDCRADEETRHHIHESPAVMWVPLAALGVLSFAGGMIGWPSALGGALVGGNHFHHFLEPVFASHAPALPHGGSELAGACVSVLIAGAGIVVGWFLYQKAKGVLPMVLAAKSKTFAWIMRTVSNKYYVDELYELVVVRPVHAISEMVLYGLVDVRLIDGLLVNGPAVAVEAAAQKVLRRLQTGVVQTYALVMMAGMVAVIAYIALR
jgi:NADH-quinone oxidoreductase subunit L